MAPVGLPPGFRFHPTDEELVSYYLRRKISGMEMELDIIPEIDLYKCEPWELADKSFLPSRDPEWYFFGPRDRKYPNGFRTNRATRAGYWKSTGKDRRVTTLNRPIGMKKTLVYYRGRAPQGIRTDWVMHEYRLDDKNSHDQYTSGIQDSYALCRVFKKNGICNEVEVEQHGGQCSSSSIANNSSELTAAAAEEEAAAANNYCNYYETTSSPHMNMNMNMNMMQMRCVEEEEEEAEEEKDESWMQFITDNDPWSSTAPSDNHSLFID